MIEGTYSYSGGEGTDRKWDKGDSNSIMRIYYNSDNSRWELAQFDWAPWEDWDLMMTMAHNPADEPWLGSWTDSGTTMAPGLTVIQDE